MLGLTTGNVEEAAHIKLARPNLNRYFAFGGYGSDSPDRTELTRMALERGELVSGHTLDRDRTFPVATPLETWTPATAPASGSWGSRPASTRPRS